MSEHAINLDRLFDLMAAVCDNSASLDDFMALDSMVRQDPLARDCYLSYCQMHSTLMLDLRAHRAAHAVLDQIGIQPTITPSSEPNIAKDETRVALSPAFLAPVYHGTISFFSQELPFSLLIAAVLTSLGLWFASMIYVSSPEKIARDSSSLPSKATIDPMLKIVGKITGMVGCKWSKDCRAPSGYDSVLMGRQFKLDAGLMEISYNSGAKVILQGPVTYEVESNGGYLAVGKLTGKLEKKLPAFSDQQSQAVASGRSRVASGQWSVASKERPGGRGQGSEPANQKSRNPEISKSPIPYPSLSTIHYPLFTIKTPTAMVTDLGTEFGVEVLRDGGTNSYVFRGKVAIEPRTVKTGSLPKIELAAGESAAVAKSGALVYAHKRPVSVKPVQFVRTIAHAKSLIAYWPMDEGRGRGAFDKSGNNINCWFTGEPAWTEGRFGRAVQLLGDGQYLSAVKDSKLNLGTGDFTVSLWFKGGSVKNWRWLLNYNGEGTKSAPGLVITTYIADGKTDSHLRASLGEWFTDVYHHLESTVTANSNTNWYHVAMTRSGKTLTGYVNGKQVFAESVPVINLVSNSDNNGDLLLGTRLASGPYYRGALDDVAIWNRALTVLQIQSLADGKATPLNVLNVESTPLEIDKPHSEVHK